MSGLLAIAAVATVAGALVAVTGRDARIALVGLVVALAAAPFLADPLPGPAALGARVVAALLGGYLLFVVLRETTAVTRGSLVGLPAETLAAAAAFVIGYGTNGLGSAALGPAAASATGFALAVIAIGPIVRGADVFRLGVALAVLVTGAELVRVGLAGHAAAARAADDRRAHRRPPRDRGRPVRQRGHRDGRARAPQRAPAERPLRGAPGDPHGPEQPPAVVAAAPADPDPARRAHTGRPSARGRRTDAGAGRDRPSCGPATTAERRTGARAAVDERARRRSSAEPVCRAASADEPPADVSCRQRRSSAPDDRGDPVGS